MPADESSNRTSFEDLGPNSGLIEEMYRRYVDSPASVAEAWREFFADYKLLGTPDSTSATVPAPTDPAPSGAETTGTETTGAAAAAPAAPARVTPASAPTRTDDDDASRSAAPRPAPS